MKYQDLFSLKNMKKLFFKMLSAAVVIGALRVNLHILHMLEVPFCLTWPILSCVHGKNTTSVDLTF